MHQSEGTRTPGFKLLLAILVGAALAIPLFSVWLLVYDRQTQSEEATASITEGWGGPQAIAGPVLVIPYRAIAQETVVENGQSVTRSRDVMRELTLSPERADLITSVAPERRKRSIYEAVVYEAKLAGTARFAFPPDLAQLGVEPGAMIATDRSRDVRIDHDGLPAEGDRGNRCCRIIADSGQLAELRQSGAFASPFQHRHAIGLACPPTGCSNIMWITPGASPGAHCPANLHLIRIGSGSAK